VFPQKIRQSWNKYNLYNLSQMAGVFSKERSRTFFQQKFSAKSMTRAYHGEHVGEKKWRRLFSRRLYTAIEMPPRYLAQYDGSEQGAGRGSGQDTPPGQPVPSARLFSDADNRLPRQIAQDRDAIKNADWRALGLQAPRDLVGETIAAPTRKITPYMQQLYWPLERRLDTAIFRALFASSVRQARQFVVHGAVTVNGIKVGGFSRSLNTTGTTDALAVPGCCGRSGCSGGSRKLRRPRTNRDTLRALHGSDVAAAPVALSFRLRKPYWHARAVGVLLAARLPGRLDVIDCCFRPGRPVARRPRALQSRPADSMSWTLRAPREVRAVHISQEPQTCLDAPGARLALVCPPR
jgi:ribosomal protein S4